MCLLALSHVYGTELELLRVDAISFGATHSAFTSLVRFDDQFFCSWREGSAHASDDGVFRVARSADGTNWISAALISIAGMDLRDPKLSVMPDGRLMLYGPEKDPLGGTPWFHNLAWFSVDGTNWTGPVSIGEDEVWLWKLAWHGNTAYGVGYHVYDPWGIRLYTSTDATNWTTHVDKLYDGGGADESSIVFMPDDTAHCIVRRDLPPYTALLGTSSPPYKDWTWQDLGHRIGGPEMIRFPDNRLLASGRMYPSGQVALWWIDPDGGVMTEALVLPSWGDGSYPGMVWYNDRLWISYYSSHITNTRVYIAEVVYTAEPTGTGYFATPASGWQYVYDARFDGRLDQDGWNNNGYQFAIPGDDNYSAVTNDQFTGEKTLYAAGSFSVDPTYSSLNIPLTSAASNEIITVDVRFRAGDASQLDSTAQFHLATVFRPRFDGLVGRQFGAVAVSEQGIQYSDQDFKFTTIGPALGTNWHTGRIVFDFPALSYHMYLDDSAGKLFTATMRVDDVSNNNFYVGDGSRGYAGQMNLSYLRYSTNHIPCGATTNLVVTEIGGNTNPTSQGQGWVESGTSGSVAGGTEGAIPYWGITGATIRNYYKNVGVSELYHHTGWTATARMRILSSTAKPSVSAVFTVQDGADHFGFYFYTNEVDYINISAGATKLTDLDAARRFHVYQICFTPFSDSGLGSVEFFVDGVSVGTKTRVDTVDSVIDQTSGGRITFGAGSSGGESDTRWASVTFEVGKHIYSPPGIVIMIR